MNKFNIKCVRVPAAGRLRKRLLYAYFGFDSAAQLEMESVCENAFYRRLSAKSDAESESEARGGRLLLLVVVLALFLEPGAVLDGFGFFAGASHHPVKSAGRPCRARRSVLYDTRRRTRSEYKTCKKRSSSVHERDI